MKLLTAFVAAVAAIAGGEACAESLVPTAITLPHDFKRGPALLREAIGNAWNGKTHIFYQGGSCSHDFSLMATQGHLDERPIEIRHVMLLGRQGLERYSPSYLFDGNRMAWFSSAYNGSNFRELPCTWIATFEGNTVRKITEANELRYLFKGQRDD